MRQVLPVAFAIMSGKRTKDYEIIFQWIKDNHHQLALKTITCDFEAAIWNAASQVFQQVSIHGFLFHWNQSVYRKIQDSGLQTAYHERKDVFQFCRKLMALPFLPAEYISDFSGRQGRQHGPTTP